ncbi:MAG: energy transducer TonB [Chitinophagaceae bacterium]|nr:energy transducer TonB [Chitinophagaceae bacterium]
MRLFLLIALSLLFTEVIAQQKISSIEMERTPCFGKCPSYIIRINANGQVYYYGKKNTSYNGKRNGKLPMVEVRKLFSAFEKYKLTSLSGVYKPLASDLSHINYQFVINKKSKQIKNADAGPVYLSKLSKQMDLALNKVVWIIDTTYDPPMEPEPVSQGPVEISKQEKQPEKEVYQFVEVMPEFPGGHDSMMKFIHENLNYPSVAIENEIQGKVICGFVVNALGEIENVRILRGISHECDQEAMRVIRKMPRWKPGMQLGKAVKVQFNLPINFKLN